jgi:hypothetical protein
VLDVKWPRTLRVTAAGVAAGALVLHGAPSATADPTNGPTVCHSSVESGVEVDTCTGNPDWNPDGGAPPFLGVVPEFCFGVGFGTC